MGKKKKHGKWKKMCYRGSETPMLPIQPLYHCIISVSSSALCGTGYGSKAEIDCVNREQRKSCYTLSVSALVSYWWSCTEHWPPIGGRCRRILSLFACQWNGRCTEIEAGGNERETIYTRYPGLWLHVSVRQFNVECAVAA